MKFIIYYKPNCLYCNKAKDLLNKKKLIFESIEITDAEKIKNFFLKQFGKIIKSVPQIYAEYENHYTYIGGFEDLQIFLKEY